MTEEGELSLAFRIRCQPEVLTLPAPLPSGPADGLWQHTCCEAFVMEDGSAYREFNFSPSGQWAAYRFTGYREPDTAFVPVAQPRLVLSLLDDGFALDATLPAGLLPSGNRLHIGLSAVIEAADGGKSYWALAHGAAQPDFHLRQSFVLTLNRHTP